MAWHSDWEGICSLDFADKVANPHIGPAPDGYVRLHRGTSPWERAEVLTQLTGKESEVREFPAGSDKWLINRIIRAQLADSKPVLVGSRDHAYKGEVLPHNLEAGHVYEVTGVDKGKIVLRNPWNREHPDPLETEEFARNMRPLYTTLI
jgi:hypothetical protein